ncbi:hypothetical protein BG004_005094 [Podila humilis]|nr:hypothetical protein BG004_005094 [Podila humilis]
MKNQGGSENLAMKNRFPQRTHLLLMWERQIKSKMTGLGAHPVKEGEEIRALFRADLRKILYERRNANAQEFIRDFRETWSDQKELLEYFNKNYFGWPMYDVHERQVKETQESWMLCYRQDISYASIDTNNYIESWHNTLKRHFFRNKQQRRPDTVIFVFAILAVPHFQQKCMRSIVNVSRMNPAQSKELRLTALATEHITTRESKGYIGASIKQTSDIALYVESFTNPALGYDVKIDFSKSPTGHI